MGDWQRAIEWTAAPGEPLPAGLVGWSAPATDAQALGEILLAEPPDPGTLYARDRDLAGFYCPDCRRPYCGRHWNPEPVLEEGRGWDYTMGTCPAGHSRIISRPD